MSDMLKAVTDAIEQASNHVSEGVAYGALRHLAKEVQEAIENPHDIDEYADCFILLLDALRIAGFTTDYVFSAAEAKHEINKKREWQPVNSEGFSEHVSKGRETD